MTWPEKIEALKRLMATTGRLWTGTRLSGYSEEGPYSCGNCRYLLDAGRPAFSPGRGAPTFARCEHPAVKADPATKKDAGGWPIVNAARGCCEFVEPPK